jgi:hypothetical protein
MMHLIYVQPLIQLIPDTLDLCAAVDYEQTLAHTRLLAGVQGTSFRRAHTGESMTLLAYKGCDCQTQETTMTWHVCMDERTTTLALAVWLSCLVSDWSLVTPSEAPLFFWYCCFQKLGLLPVKFSGLLVTLIISFHYEGRLFINC